MYLSTTDYVQHRTPPGSPAAIDFYRMVDAYLAWLDSLGATIARTADHGMNDKYGADKQLNAIYLQDILDVWLGKNAARVILPITDPYVAHHGALGSFATAYFVNGVDLGQVTDRIAALDGIELVLSNSDACARFELPSDAYRRSCDYFQSEHGDRGEPRAA